MPNEQTTVTIHNGCKHFSGQPTTAGNPAWMMRLARHKPNKRTYLGNARPLQKTTVDNPFYLCTKGTIKINWIYQQSWFGFSHVPAAFEPIQTQPISRREWGLMQSLREHEVLIWNKICNIRFDLIHYLSTFYEIRPNNNIHWWQT